MSGLNKAVDRCLILQIVPCLLILLALLPSCTKSHTIHVDHVNTDQKMVAEFPQGKYVEVAGQSIQSISLLLEKQ
ncbi:MAG: hypothetical protein ACRBF0_11130 [Calditrichia bacterium]